MLGVCTIICFDRYDSCHVLENMGFFVWGQKYLACAMDLKSFDLVPGGQFRYVNMYKHKPHLQINSGPYKTNIVALLKFLHQSIIFQIARGTKF